MLPFILFTEFGLFPRLDYEYRLLTLIYGEHTNKEALLKTPSIWGLQCTYHVSWASYLFWEYATMCTSVTFCSVCCQTLLLTCPASIHNSFIENHTLCHSQLDYNACNVLRIIQNSNLELKINSNTRGMPLFKELQMLWLPNVRFWLCSNGTHLTFNMEL